MLAQILPGFRDFRTPLIAGYIWLIGFWIFLGLPVPSLEAEVTLLAPVRSLALYFGAPTVLAVLSFIAYLLGVLLSSGTFSTGAPARFLYSIRKRGRKLLGMRNPPSRPAAPEAAEEDYLSLAYREIDDAKRKNADWSQMIEEYSIPDSVRDEEGKIEWQKFSRRLADEVSGILAEEVENIDASLQVANEKLFNDYDRARSEQVFRVGVSTPLFFLALSIAFLIWPQDWQASIIVGLTGLLILGRLRTLAERKAVEATEIAIAAVKANIVTPRCLQQIRDLPTGGHRY